MNRKNNRYMMSIVLLMVLLIVGPNNHIAFAEGGTDGGGGGGGAGGGTPPPGDGNGNDIGDGPSSGGGGEDDKSVLIPDWVYDLMEKLDAIWTNIQDLISGKLIKEMIDNFIVAITDEFFSPLYGAFAKIYLFSPQIAEIEVVSYIWTMLSVIGLSLLTVGLVILVIQVSRGKKSMAALAWIFLASFVCLLMSLTVANFINVGMNWIVQEAMANMLGTEDVDFQALTGQDIVKALVVGADAFNDSSYQAMTPGELVLQTEGGLITLIFFGGFVLFPLWIVTVLKTFVAILLVMFVPVWVTMMAYKGNYEVALGWLNLYLRTLLVGVMISFHWAIFVKSQSEYGEGFGLASYLGIAPLWMAILSMALVIAAAYFFWFKHVIDAVKTPVTLNGGKVIENMGEFGKNASEITNNIAKRMGLEDLQRKTLNWSERSEKMADYGRDLQEKRLKKYMKSKVASVATGGISEAFTGVKYEELGREEWTKDRGDVNLEVAKDLKYTKPEFFGVQKAKATMALRKQGFGHGTHFALNGTDVQKMNKLLSKPEFKERYGEFVNWDSNLGDLVISKHDDAIIAEMQNEKITTDDKRLVLQREGMYMDLTSERFELNAVGAAKESLNSVVQHINQNNVPVYRPIELPPSESREVFDDLVSKRDVLPWVDRIEFDKELNRIMVPDDLITDVQEVLSDRLMQLETHTCFAMPEGSSFMKMMLEEWTKQTEIQPLMSRILPEVENNVIYVPKEDIAAFQRQFELYRSERIPYWRTKSGQIKVIQEGIPVDYGSVPVMGMDMGSFENYRDKTLWNHSA